MHVCDAFTGAVYFDEGDGKIIEAMTHRPRVYERHKAAGAFDGPVIYRVTWMLTDGSRERRTQDFTNIDHGYDFYEDRQKTRTAPTSRGITSEADRSRAKFGAPSRAKQEMCARRGCCGVTTAAGLRRTRVACSAILPTVREVLRR